MAIDQASMQALADALAPGLATVIVRVRQEPHRALVLNVELLRMTTVLSGTVVQATDQETGSLVRVIYPDLAQLSAEGAREMDVVTVTGQSIIEAIEECEIAIERSRASFDDREGKESPERRRMRTLPELQALLRKQLACAALARAMHRGSVRMPEVDTATYDRLIALAEIEGVVKPEILERERTARRARDGGRL